MRLSLHEMDLLQSQSTGENQGENQFISDQKKLEIIKQVKNMQANEELDEIEKKECVTKVCCGSVNTVMLTNTGEVLVLGDNTYG